MPAVPGAWPASWAVRAPALPGHLQHRAGVGLLPPRSSRAVPGASACRPTQHTVSSAGVDPAVSLRPSNGLQRFCWRSPVVSRGPVTSGFSWHLPRRIPAVPCDASVCAACSGSRSPDAEVVDILQRLDMRVEVATWGWQVAAASFRFDIAIEVDLIEEIARFAAMNTCRSAWWPADARGSVRRAIGGRTRAPEGCAGRARLPGSDHLQLHRRGPGPDWPAVDGRPLVNPISAELAVMRQTLWPGLINAVRHNLARQQTRCVSSRPACGSSGRARRRCRSAVIAGVAIGNVLSRAMGCKACLGWIL